MFFYNTFHTTINWFVFVKIAPKRWRLEINFSQDAVLMLSSMNLPDGIQVRFSAYLPCSTLKLDRQ
jgi:hypothetical protein